MIEALFIGGAIIAIIGAWLALVKLAAKITGNKEIDQAIKF